MEPQVIDKKAVLQQRPPMLERHPVNTILEIGRLLEIWRTVKRINTQELSHILSSYTGRSVSQTAVRNTMAVDVTGRSQTFFAVLAYIGCLEQWIDNVDGNFELRVYSNAEERYCPPDWEYLTGRFRELSTAKFKEKGVDVKEFTAILSTELLGGNLTPRTAQKCVNLEGSVKLQYMLAYFEYMGWLTGLKDELSKIVKDIYMTPQNKPTINPHETSESFYARLRCSSKVVQDTYWQDMLESYKNDMKKRIDEGEFTYQAKNNTKI